MWFSGNGRVVLLVAGAALCAAQPIRIDHTTTDLSLVPDYWIAQARRLTLYYGFTSHGSQIVSGLEALKRIDGKYNFAILRDSSVFGLPAASGALLISGGTPEDYVTPELFWSLPAGRANTQAAASTGLYRHAAWSWCGQQSSNSTATVQQYLDTMHAFETANPGMHFILFTGHTDGGGATLERNNNLVRDYARANNKVLFDFADIESWDPAGNQYPNTADDCSWCSSWCQSHPSGCAVLPSSCAHSHPFNCLLKARAFWWMMARLAGWNGPEAADRPVITAAGVVNAASNLGGPVAAYEIVSLYGQRLAAATGTTRVFFDGVAAPILHASAGQVNAIVPGAVAGRASTTLQVEASGVLSDPVTLPVAEFAPGLFLLDASGQAAALHTDYSVNGPANPVPRGAAVALYATAGLRGTGLPPDGSFPTQASPLDATVTAEVGGVSAPVLYAGAAPTLVAGALQVNIAIPPGAPAGPAVPVVLTFNGARTQPGVTLAIH